MVTRTQVAAAAAQWVRERLGGPPRHAAIVHAGSDAVYVDDRGRCIGLLGRSAVSVPCGLQTTLDSLPPVAANGTARLGAGVFALAELEVRVGRTVDATVPRLHDSPADPGVVARAAGGRLDSAYTELPPKAVDALRDGDPAAVPALLGRGSGLTPLGDDVLCGWVATRLALGHDTAAVTAAIRDLAARGTTLLSATLLDRACAGDVIPAFRSLLLALGSGAAVGPAVDALLATGHTSGAGMLLGSALALEPSGPTEQRRHR